MLYVNRSSVDGLIAPLMVIAALIVTTFISAGLTPPGASGPLGSPDASSLLLWLAALALIVLYSLLFTRHSSLVTRHLSSCLPVSNSSSPPAPCPTTHARLRPMR